MTQELPSRFNYIDMSDVLFSQALDKCLNSKKNLFIKGKAGSGKCLGGPENITILVEDETAEDIESFLLSLT